MTLFDHTSEANYQVRNDELKVLLQRLAEDLTKQLPPGWGFNLQIFEFTPGNSLFYISNASREDVIKMMKEWIARNTQ